MKKRNFFLLLLLINILTVKVTKAENYECVYDTSNIFDNMPSIKYDITKNLTEKKITLPFGNNISNMGSDTVKINSVSFVISHYGRDNKGATSFISDFKEDSLFTDCPNITIVINKDEDLSRIYSGNSNNIVICNLDATCYTLTPNVVYQENNTTEIATETNNNTKTNSDQNTVTRTTNTTKNNNKTNTNTTNYQYVKCGDITGIPAGLPEFSRNVINIIKYVIPIILCILGMIDFAKAVISNDEKAMSDGPKKFIKRVISAILIYFVVAIVQFIFNILGDSDSEQQYVNKDNINSCIKCFISDESGCSEDTETK